MKTAQLQGKQDQIDSLNLDPLFNHKPNIGFVFGSVDVFQNKSFIDKLLNYNTDVKWLGCSTAGEVTPDGVLDNTIILTTLTFENPNSKFKIVKAEIDSDGGYSAGKKIGDSIFKSDLKSMIVISPGVGVNGSALVKGISETVGDQVIITGGLAGDGGQFVKTWTLSPDGVSDNHAVAVGFYGETLQLRHGCMGGWDPFGKVRRVTKAKDNILFEIDGRPALEIYKEYLGEQAKDLPSSGLMFPFALLNNEEQETGLIRTILGVDEVNGSLIMAGDMPNKVLVRLMHANTKGLVTGAQEAANNILSKGQVVGQSFSLIISCVGRKIIMGPNVDDEIEVISEVLGDQCAVAGFYSYGEISPFLDEVACKLHNQTMTISHLHEK